MSAPAVLYLLHHPAYGAVKVGITGHLRSAMAAPYEGGRAQAVGGSRIVERDYRTWDASAAAAQRRGRAAVLVSTRKSRSVP